MVDHKKGADLKLEIHQQPYTPSLTVLGALLLFIFYVAFPAADALAKKHVVDPWGLEGSAADNLGYRPFRLLALHLVFLSENFGYTVVKKALVLLVFLLGRCVPRIPQLIDGALDWLSKHPTDHDYSPSGAAGNSSPLLTSAETSPRILILIKDKSVLAMCHDFLLTAVSFGCKVSQNVLVAAAAAVPVAAETFLRQYMAQVQAERIAKGEKPLTPGQVNAFVDDAGSKLFVAYLALLVLHYLENTKESPLKPRLSSECLTSRRFPSSPKNLGAVFGFLLRTAFYLNTRIPEVILNSGSAMFKTPGAEFIGECGQGFSAIVS